MTSWLELVELTMEGSCLPELQPCLPNRALVTALQARPLPPLLPWGSLWPHVCQMAILSGCGGSFQDPWWLTFGWLAAVLQNSRDCWGLLGGAQAPPPHRSFQIYKDDLWRSEVVGGVLQGAEGGVGRTRYKSGVPCSNHLPTTLTESGSPVPSLPQSSPCTRALNWGAFR